MLPTQASNFVFAGSTIAAGRGLAVVYATRTHTEFGQVAHLTTNVKREASTLEVQISKVVNIITMIALGMGMVIFLLTKLVVGRNVTQRKFYLCDWHYCGICPGRLTTYCESILSYWC